MQTVRVRAAVVAAALLTAVAVIVAPPRQTIMALAFEPASTQEMRQIPAPFPPFEGKIGRTYEESEPAWPKLPTAPAGAPNIVLIMLDDVGFGQPSTFGGLIPTPQLDELAAQGIKYNRFHTTAVCGPSRAALLTGRNHHTTGNGFLMEWATGYPSYNTMIPRDTATIAEILKDNGYTTWWFGKNHNTPDWETSVAGPFDRWPTSLGFDYFYGFNAGETHQYYPTIFENTLPVEPDKTPEEGYHFMTDMTDRAIARMRYFKSVAPDKPFFMYFAPGAAHAPHHVTAEWRDKFKGAFDMGWDKYREQVFARQKAMGIVPPDTELTARPDWVPPWDSLSDQQKKLYTALFENFTGYLAFADYEVGRLLDAVDALPDADNTLVIYITSDNGASSEGGPDGTLNEIKSLNGIPTAIEETLKGLDKLGGPETEPHYPVGWAWAGNTPFQWVKQVASHLGGTRVGMVVSWPARFGHDDTVHSQFLHLVDVTPTILEVTGVTFPETVNGIKQTPLAGKSFAGSFTDARAPGRTEQYFEVLSNRSIYLDGWKANAQHTLPWRQDLAPGNWDKDRWELYNLDEDFSEARDLSAAHPKKLAELKAAFDDTARKYGVYPLDDRGAARLAVPKPPPPGFDPNATKFTFYAGATRLPETAAPPMKNRSWTVTAKVMTEGAKTNGVILAFGGVATGFVLYVDAGKPVFDYNYFEEHTVIAGDAPLPSGESTVALDFVAASDKPGAGGVATLSVNGKKVARGSLDATVAGRFGVDTFGIGEDSSQPVTFAYKPPFKFTGTIRQVDVEVK